MPGALGPLRPHCRVILPCHSDRARRTGGARVGAGHRLDRRGRCGPRGNTGPRKPRSRAPSGRRTAPAGKNRMRVAATARAPDGRRFLLRRKVRALCLLRRAADRRSQPGRSFDICLCHSEDDALPIVGDIGVDLRLCRIETGGALRGLSLDQRRTASTYLRLAMPAAFEGQYERVLYWTRTYSCRAGISEPCSRLGWAAGRSPRSGTTSSGARRDGVLRSSAGSACPLPLI